VTEADDQTIETGRRRSRSYPENPPIDETSISTRKIEDSDDTVVEDKTAVSMRRLSEQTEISERDHFDSTRISHKLADQTELSKRRVDTLTDLELPVRKARTANETRTVVSASARIAYDPGEDGVKVKVYMPREVPAVQERPPRVAVPPPPPPRVIKERRRAGGWPFVVAMGVIGTGLLAAIVWVITTLA
jgi:hypothetical protein